MLPMTQRDEIIQQLLEKLDALGKRQETFSKEINALKEEIKNLQLAPDHAEPQKPVQQVPPPINAVDTPQDELSSRPPTIHIPPPIQRPPDIPVLRPQPPRKSKSEMEQFIGSNLINKIGIAITIIGVAIGAKYSIDHDLISPLARIVLGYVIGIALLGFGFKLKNVVQSRGTISQQVGFNKPLRSIFKCSYARKCKKSKSCAQAAMKAILGKWTVQ